MRVSDTEDIGIIARQRRKELRISQLELAARAGVTRQWLTRFERGNSEVSLSKVFAVLRELDLKVRLDAAEDVAARSKVAAFEIPRITMPSTEIPSVFPNFKVSDIITTNVRDNIITSIRAGGVPPLNDPKTLAQVKSRIHAIEAAKSDEARADE